LQRALQNLHPYARLKPGLQQFERYRELSKQQEEANERYWQKRQRAAEQRYQDWAKQQKDP
jgi:hypothetical protein